MVGISLSSFTVGAELSKPFAKYLSVSATWSGRGTLELVTSASRLRFAFGKASAAVTLVGRLKRLDCLPHPLLPLPPSWSSSPRIAPVCRSLLSLPTSSSYTSRIRRKFPWSGVHSSLMFLYFLL